MLEPIKKY